MPAYDVTIRVPDEEGLSATISGMRSSCNLRSVTPVGKSVKISVKASPQRKADKLTGRDLLAIIFKGKATRTTKEIRDAFVEAGFAANSASPQISAAKQRGEINLVSDNTYKRV